MHQARSLAAHLRHHGNRHAKLGQCFPSQCLKGRGRIQLAADGFGDGQAGADALAALVQGLDGDGLVQVLTQEHRQIVLGQADQTLLALEAGAKRIDTRSQLRETGMIGNSQGSLSSKDLQ